MVAGAKCFFKMYIYYHTGMIDAVRCLHLMSLHVSAMQVGPDIKGAKTTVLSLLKSSRERDCRAIRIRGLDLLLAHIYQICIHCIP